MSAAEAEAEIISTHGPVSVDQKIDMAEELAYQSACLYASAWAQCLEIKTQLPHDP
jgi:hypothetical protein